MSERIERTIPPAVPVLAAISSGRLYRGLVTVAAPVLQDKIRGGQRDGVAGIGDFDGEIGLGVAVDVALDGVAGRGPVGSQLTRDAGKLGGGCDAAVDV